MGGIIFTYKHLSLHERMISLCAFVRLCLFKASCSPIADFLTLFSSLDQTTCWSLRQFTITLYCFAMLHEHICSFEIINK